MIKVCAPARGLEYDTLRLSCHSGLPSGYPAMLQDARAPVAGKLPAVLSCSEMSQVPNRPAGLPAVLSRSEMYRVPIAWSLPVVPAMLQDVRVPITVSFRLPGHLSTE